MNNKSITPNPQQPVDRVPTGQLPSALAELSEAELSARGVLPSSAKFPPGFVCVQTNCSYDGDDE
jgi:bacteriocin leader peptide (microcyclamide/patellamide family)